MAGKRTLPGLGLTAFWAYMADNWNVEMDANLVKLSAMTGQLAAQSRTVGIGSWDKTKIYIVPASAADNPNKIAIWNNDPVEADQKWLYITPQEGWGAFVVDEAQQMQFLYSAWAPPQFTFSKAYMESGYDQRWLTDLTLASGFAQTANYQSNRYRRAMTFVDLDLEVTTTAAITNGTSICTLPAGYRPPANIVLPVASSIVGTRVIIGTDGTVKAYSFTAAGMFSLHAHFSLL